MGRRNAFFYKAVSFNSSAYYSTLKVRTAAIINTYAYLSITKSKVLDKSLRGLPNIMVYCLLDDVVRAMISCGDILFRIIVYRQGVLLT